MIDIVHISVLQPVWDPPDALMVPVLTSKTSYMFG